MSETGLQGQGLGAWLRHRAGRPSARAMLRCLGYSATIPCAALLASCGKGFEPVSIECVNIVSHERLTDTDLHSLNDIDFGFYGTDAQGYRRVVYRQDARWWKCRFTPEPRP